jgi:hypothetical protein
MKLGEDFAISYTLFHPHLGEWPWKSTSCRTLLPEAVNVELSTVCRTDGLLGTCGHHRQPKFVCPLIFAAII